MKNIKTCRDKILLMTKIIFLTLLIVGIFTAASLATNEAYAAVDMFLKIDGIDGEAVDLVGGHTGDIEVLAWSWGMTQSGPIGNSAGAGKVNIQDLSITKFIDRSSTDFWEFLAEGEGGEESAALWTLTVRNATAPMPVDYLVITLKNVRVTSVSTGGSSADDRITETIILNFAEIEMQYTTQDPTGGPGDTKTWNHKKLPGHR